MAVRVPFVDLNLQHQPIQNQLEKAINSVLNKGDFILGKAVADFEVAYEYVNDAFLKPVLLVQLVEVLDHKFDPMKTLFKG